MKHLAFLLVILPLVVGFTSDTPQAPPQHRDYVLQIFSSDNSPVTYEGSYLTDRAGKEGLTQIMGTTAPPETRVTIKTNHLYILLKKTGGTANLAARLLVVSNGKEHELVSGDGSNSIVIAQDDNSDNSHYISIF